MNEKVSSFLARVLWSAGMTGVVMVFATVAMLTQYHGTPHMYILGYGLGLAAGLAAVIIFARWSMPVVVLGAILAYFVFHVALGTLVAATVGFALGFLVLLRWSYNDRHDHRRV